MNLLLISDTHNQHHALTELPSADTVDMIIHSGDMTGRGTIEEIERFLEWYHALPYTHKILIAGNHDFAFEDYPALMERLLKKYPSITYLEGSSVTIEGIKIHGSPWTPRFYDWAFNADRGEVISKAWEQIPVDTDILVTHGPPAGFGDLCAHGERVGCKDLLDRIRVVKPKLVVFGHIHEGYGMYRDPNGKTTYVNASVLDENYWRVNDPVLVNYYDFV